MSSLIVNPLTANVMNAVMCGLMSFGLLMTPQNLCRRCIPKSLVFKSSRKSRQQTLLHRSIYGIPNVRWLSGSYIVKPKFPVFMLSDECHSYSESCTFNGFHVFRYV